MAISEIGSIELAFERRDKHAAVVFAAAPLAAGTETFRRRIEISDLKFEIRDLKLEI